MGRHMGNSHLLGSKADTKVHVALILLVLMLSADWANPVQLLCKELGLKSNFFALPAVYFLIYVVWSDVTNVVYFSVRIFMHTVLSIYFMRIEVTGVENIPVEGPVIFTGNHANQFLDAIVVMCTARHKVGFLIAQASYDRPLVGMFAKMMGCIPIIRAQDTAVRSSGRVTIAPSADGGGTVTGDGTKFLAECEVGGRVRLEGCADQYKIAEIVSDVELVLAPPSAAAKPAPKESDKAFDALPKPNHAAAFTHVFDHIAAGGCLGIFPEGGSHDRTDLLPLKAGVALIALGAVDSHNVAVPVVPVGLSYFDAGRGLVNYFRGRIVVQFGPPIRPTPEQHELYRTDARAATTQFLELVEDGMRGCLVTVSTFKELKLVQTARRLFQRTDYAYDAAATQDMTRRFVEGYKILHAQATAAVEESASKGGRRPSLSSNAVEELGQLKKRIELYRDKLSSLGISDAQVPTLNINPWRTLLDLGHLTTMVAISSFPNVLLNLPVGAFAAKMAFKEQKSALKKSRVKLEANDVVATKFILVCIVGIPVLWLTYALLLLSFTSVQRRTVVFLLVLAPVFSYMGIISAESGMVALKDVRPVLARLWSGAMRREQNALKEERKALQRDLRGLVLEHREALGPLGEEGPVDWDRFYARKRSDSR